MPTKRWKLIFWLGLVAMASFLGTTAGCSPNQAVNELTEMDGPTLIVFYTDN